MLFFTLSFMTEGCSAYPIIKMQELKKCMGYSTFFSSIIGNTGKTKADFDLSPCSVKTYYFKVRMSQPRRGHSQLFLKLSFLKHTPQVLDPEKKGFVMSKVNQLEASVALKCLFNHYYFSSYFQHLSLTASPPGGGDKQFSTFNKCRDINITNVLKYLTVAQRSIGSP